MIVIDSDEVCPVVLVQVFRAFKDAKNNEEIVVKTRWEAVTQELQKWCEQTGNKFLGWEKEGEKYKVRIVVVKK